MTNAPNPGAALVAMRQIVELTCAHCGKTFTARRAKKDGPRYHSASCRTLAYQARQRTTRAPAAGEED